MTAEGATEIRVTLDGSDPRYSDSAVIYSTPIATTALGSGSHLARAVAYKDGGFTSNVTDYTFTK